MQVTPVKGLNSAAFAIGNEVVLDQIQGVLIADHEAGLEAFGDARNQGIDVSESFLEQGVVELLVSGFSEEPDQFLVVSHGENSVGVKPFARGFEHIGKHALQVL